MEVLAVWLIAIIVVIVGALIRAARSHGDPKDW